MEQLRYTHLVLALGVTLFGCAGPDFAVGQGTSEAGASGAEVGGSDPVGAGTGGAPSAGKGGESGSAGKASSGGTSGSSTAGSGGSQAGTSAASGGAGAAGAAGTSPDAGEGGSGNDSGSGGVPTTAGSGGSAGSPVTPTCSPSEAILADRVPTTLAWPGFAVSTAGACASSFGGTCSLSDVVVGTGSGTEPMVLVMTVTCEETPMLCGACGDESVAASGFVTRLTTQFSFEAEANGYVTHFTVGDGGSLNLLDRPEPPVQCTDYAEALYTSLWKAAAESFINGKVWACP